MKLEIGPRLCEKDVEVTEYISDHQGFTGVFKDRFTDFQVHEIDNEGKIAVLTDKKVPAKTQQKMVHISTQSAIIFIFFVNIIFKF